ncbi:MAG: hypothetical protein ACOC9B_05010 [Chloroflexota bacterium]
MHLAERLAALVRNADPRADPYEVIALYIEQHYEPRSLEALLDARGNTE